MPTEKTRGYGSNLASALLQSPADLVTKTPDAPANTHRDKMPTIKQKNAVKEIVGNGGNITKAMRKVGYSEGTINTPQKLTESQGFKSLMESQGLSPEFLNTCLKDDIKAKKGNRFQELQLSYKLHGLLKDTVIEAKDLTIHFDNAFKTDK